MKLSAHSMDEKTSASKNNDCYFYYYSSCSKGDACPYRHEPAALRNETVCIYWLQRKCNKSNCIFRHMELSKQRDKIACWFESQPGGCKKPHCPFQHQNILDHPREEDIKKKPDLILPVKKDDSVLEENVSASSEVSDHQVMLSRSDSGGHTPPRQVHQSTITRNPIIVPLQDGESDSESVSGSPLKRVKDSQLSAQLEWELRRLRQIQAHEADIIGYQFADEDDDEAEEEDENSEAEEGDMEDEVVQTPEVEEEYVVEEVVEVEEEEDTDAAHRRLHPPHEENVVQPKTKYAQVPVVKDPGKNVYRPQASNLKDRKRLQISERLGGVASRALAETLGTKVLLRSPPSQRITNKEEDLPNADVKRLKERLGLKAGKKTSIAARLGTRKEQAIVISSDEESNGVDSSIASRITNIRHHQVDTKETVLDGAPVHKSIFSKEEEDPGLNFTVKSLADIKAEKQKRKVTVKRLQPSKAKNGTKPRSALSRLEPSARGRIDTKAVNKTGSVNPTRIEPPEKEKQSFKILSLGEIKSNKKVVLKNYVGNSAVSGPKTKRPISPIYFPKEDKASLREKTSLSHDSLTEVDEGKQADVGRRRISIKRSPVKSPGESEPLQKVQRIKEVTPPVSATGTRKISLVTSIAPVRKITPVTTSNALIRKITAVSTSTSVKKDSSNPCSQNNNVIDNRRTISVPLSDKEARGVHKSNIVQITKSPSISKVSMSQGGLSRNDSLIEDDEELLLAGDTLELEEGVDEAALLI
ncbi:hypothetical protein SK128_022408 [Halocaridina rubra]|uniref:C3H1-type domain-containing protein n=1 Tax=Halocaridina rubra TaxID=373956 RepID=A0AAN9AG29_HALRR